MARWSATTRRARYTPDRDFHGVDTFTYTVSDGVDTATAAVTVTVDPVNDPPVAADDAATTDEDTAATIEVVGNDSDVDGDPLTVEDHTQPPTATWPATRRRARTPRTVTSTGRQLHLHGE